MSEKSSDKIQNLLKQAAQQEESLTPEASSVADAALLFTTETEAEESFAYFREKLLHINRWNNSSAISSFALFDETGAPQKEKIAAPGDFIKINLHGSGKYDWVKITDIYDNPNEVVLTVRPSIDPTDKTNEKTISHFFTADSTNNFCLQKNGEKLKFYVIGLSEKTNTEETSGIIETVRNLATAHLGRYLGIQKTQWKTFCENFLKLKSEN